MAEESGVILRAVSAPGTLLGAAPTLTKASAGFSLVFFLFTLNGFKSFIVFGLLHGLMVWLTSRDPDIVEVTAAWVRVRRFPWLPGAVPSFYPVRGNRYAP